MDWPKNYLERVQDEKGVGKMAGYDEVQII